MPSWNKEQNRTSNIHQSASAMEKMTYNVITVFASATSPPKQTGISIHLSLSSEKIEYQNVMHDIQTLSQIERDDNNITFFIILKEAVAITNIQVADCPADSRLTVSHLEYTCTRSLIANLSENLEAIGRLICLGKFVPRSVIYTMEMKEPWNARYVDDIVKQHIHEKRGKSTLPYKVDKSIASSNVVEAFKPRSNQISVPKVERGRMPGYTARDPKIDLSVNARPQIREDLAQKKLRELKSQSPIRQTNQATLINDNDSKLPKLAYDKYSSASRRLELTNPKTETNNHNRLYNPDDYFEKNQVRRILETENMGKKEFSGTLVSKSMNKMEKGITTDEWIIRELEAKEKTESREEQRRQETERQKRVTMEAEELRRKEQERWEREEKRRILEQELEELKKQRIEGERRQELERKQLAAEEARQKEELRKRIEEMYRQMEEQRQQKIEEEEEKRKRREIQEKFEREQRMRMQREIDERKRRAEEEERARKVQEEQRQKAIGEAEEAERRCKMEIEKEEATRKDEEQRKQREMEEMKRQIEKEKESKKEEERQIELKKQEAEREKRFMEERKRQELERQRQKEAEEARRKEYEQQKQRDLERMKRLEEEQELERINETIKKMEEEEEQVRIIVEKQLKIQKEVEERNRRVEEEEKVRNLEEQRRKAMREAEEAERKRKMEMEREERMRQDEEKKQKSERQRQKEAEEDAERKKQAEREKEEARRKDEEQRRLKKAEEEKERQREAEERNRLAQEEEKARKVQEERVREAQRQAEETERKRKAEREMEEARNKQREQEEDRKNKEREDFSDNESLLSILDLNDPSQPEGYGGLSNIGNTCFMNSILQNLCNIQMFANYFLKDKHLRHMDLGSERGKSALLFGEIIKGIKTKGSIHNIMDLVKHLLKELEKLESSFDMNSQKDANEFFYHLLQVLSSDITRIKVTPPYQELTFDPLQTKQVNSDKWFNNFQKRENSIVTDLFYGQLFCKKKCTNNNHKRLMFENFLDLKLPLKNKAKTTGRYHLNNMLYTCFNQRENIDSLYCNECKKDMPFTECKQIWRLPRILAINLYRFTCHNGKFEKIDASITFPVQILDLSQFVIKSTDSSVKDATYTLCGIVNHTGTARSGHYTAQCKIQSKGEWYEFDDDKVTKIDINQKEVTSSSVYMLFY